MLLSITTLGQVTLLIVAGAFIAWALITAIWIPKRNPDFPVALSGFVLVSAIFLALQLGTVYWVTTTQEVESEAAASETTPAETTPAETTPPETTPAETTPAETTPAETTPTETETTPAETTPAAGAGDPVAGKEIFTTTASPPCAGCHTLADAGATGTVGPNLDEAMPSHELVVERVTNGQGAMPSFSGSLTEAQIQDVAAYVSSVAGK